VNPQFITSPKGAWQMFLVSAAEMRLKTEGQNDSHPPGCVYILVLKLMLWHLDTLLKENVNWKN